jgi:tRNA G37 N-methylase Trm5
MVKYIFFITGYLATPASVHVLIQSLIDNKCQGVICTYAGNKQLVPFQYSIDTASTFNTLKREGSEKAPNWNADEIISNLKCKYQEWYDTIKNNLKSDDTVIIMGHSYGGLSAILLAPHVRYDKIIVMNPWMHYYNIPDQITYPVGWMVSKLPLCTYS